MSRVQEPSTTQTIRLWVIGGLLGTLAAVSHAATVASSQLSLSDLRFDIASIDAQATQSPAYALSGPPMQAYFFGGTNPGSTALWPATSTDGTRQVQGSPESWTMSLNVSGEQLTTVWNTPGLDNPRWYVLGSQVSVARPFSNYPSDMGSFEPQLVTLSPRSVLTISGRAEVHNQVDVQAITELLSPYNTDQVRPYFMLGARVSVDSAIWADEPTEQELAALGEFPPEWLSMFDQSGTYLGFGFDANGQMPAPTEGFDIPLELQSFRGTIVNPFDREMTFRLDFLGSQELAMFEGEVLPSSSTVPEPGAWALMGLGLVGLAVASRRRTR
ncbi:MAG: hypothetical protein RI907_2658 [Pseudomonadota bacterium]|jgi:hypothetical protein